MTILRKPAVLILTAVFSVLFTCSVWSDTLHLKDGRQISGTLVDASASQLRFKNADGRTESFAKSDISALLLGDVTASSLAATIQAQPSSSQSATVQTAPSTITPMTPSTTTPSTTTPTPSATPPFPTTETTATAPQTTPPAQSPAAPSSSAAISGQTRAPGVSGNIFTVPASSTLSVRMTETINSETNKVGGRFRGVLEQDLMVNGTVVASKGTEVSGVIVETSDPAVASGKTPLTLELTEVMIEGRAHPLVAADISSQPQAAPGQAAAPASGRKLGKGAIAGNVVGGAAGAGRGVGVGAGVGAGASAAANVSVKGEAIRVPSDTVIEFRLQQPWIIQDFKAATPRQ